MLGAPVMKSVEFRHERESTWNELAAMIARRH